MHEYKFKSWLIYNFSLSPFRIFKQFFLINCTYVYDNMALNLKWNDAAWMCMCKMGVVDIGFGAKGKLGTPISLKKIQQKLLKKKVLASTCQKSALSVNHHMQKLS